MIHEKIFLATHFEINIPNFSIQTVTIRKQGFIYKCDSRELNLLLQCLDSIAEKNPTNFKSN